MEYSFMNGKSGPKVELKESIRRINQNNSAYYKISNNRKLENSFKTYHTKATEAFIHLGVPVSK